MCWWPANQRRDRNATSSASSSTTPYTHHYRGVVSVSLTCSTTSPLYTSASMICRPISHKNQTRTCILKAAGPARSKVYNNPLLFFSSVQCKKTISWRRRRRRKKRWLARESLLFLWLLISLKHSRQPSRRWWLLIGAISYCLSHSFAESKHPASRQKP